MAEDEIPLNHEAADPSAFIIVNIGAANPYVFQFNKHLMILRHRDISRPKLHIS
jgi:hypothetical protein